MAVEFTDLMGYVVLTEEPNLMRAHLVAGALHDAGIPAHCEDDSLADEWAMSQKLLGAIGVRVLVPASRLAEARTVFLAMSQPIPVIDEDEELDEYAAVKARRHRMLVIGFFALAALPILYLAISEVAARFGWF